MTDVFDVTGGSTNDGDIPVKPTILSDLRSALADKVRLPVFDHVIPNRPTVALMIDPNRVSARNIQVFRRRANDKALQDVDATKFGCLVIIDSTVGIKFKGNIAVDDEGDPFTFASPELLAMMGDGSLRAVDAVQWLFGTDAHIFTAVEDILNAAGFGDEEDADDADSPTQTS